MRRPAPPAPTIQQVLASEKRLRAPSVPLRRDARSALLASPSPYAVAMGGLSLQSVWESLRDTGLADCDRAFCQAPDGPAIVPERSVVSYDLVGFSLPYELDWVNVPSMLVAGGVPVWAEDRGEDDPLILAGGASVTMNPEPLADIVDAFVIGEVEPVAEPLARVLWGHLTVRRRDRSGCLDALAALPGVYVPSRRQRQPVGRLVWDGIKTNPRRSLVISPHSTFADRFLVETGRGCPWGCRFCLARRVYEPVRYARPDAVLAAATDALRVTPKIGLIGAALSRYPHLEDVVEDLVAAGADVSLSSLRADQITRRLVGALKRGGQRTVTIAPEAGTERLRHAIGKAITDDQLLEALSAADAEGLREVKLYFMTGLPSEANEDALAIAELVASWVRAFPRLRFEVAISPFVPKPWTPFEGAVFPGVSETRDRLEAAGNGLRRRAKITARLGSPRWAAVQAALARGDRSVGRALVLAAEQGGGYAALKKALKAEGVDLRAPLTCPPDPPWRRALNVDEVHCRVEASGRGHRP